MGSGNAVIGEVTDDGLLQFLHGWELEAQIPAENCAWAAALRSMKENYKEPAYFEKN